MGLNEKTTLQELEKVETEFKKFRLEKALIKNIKFKVGVINANYDLNKWETLGSITVQLGSSPEDKKEKKITLSYQKYKHLELSAITQIYGREMGL